MASTSSSTAATAADSCTRAAFLLCHAIHFRYRRGQLVDTTTLLIQKRGDFTMMSVTGNGIPDVIHGLPAAFTPARSRYRRGKPSLNQGFNLFRRVSSAGELRTSPATTANPAPLFTRTRSLQRRRSAPGYWSGRQCRRSADDVSDFLRSCRQFHAWFSPHHPPPDRHAAPFRRALPAEKPDALSAFCFTVAVSCSMLAAVSSSAEACCSVREERDRYCPSQFRWCRYRWHLCRYARWQRYR